MANQTSDRNKIIGGMAWKLAERLSNQGVTFIVSIVLARLLTPAEYGVIAMMNIFIAIANVFVVAGFNSSLIQKKDADELDFSTVFYCTLVMSILVYGIMFLASPFIAKYYNMPEMTILTRVFSISLIIHSYQAVQSAYISRHMIFRSNFVASLIANILSGIIGIVMAYYGFGVWALVSQHLAASMLGTIALGFIVKWHPSLVFSWERAKSLLDYGSKILGSTLVNTIYKEIRQLLIGLYYTPVDLALYNRGSQIPQLVTTNLDNSLRSVLFPAMANHSDDLPRVKQMLRRSIITTSYVTYFCLILLAVASEPIIRILLTDKWIECVPYMQILCVSYMVMTVSSTNLQALKAIGKSNEVLKLELFKKPAFLVVILLSLPFGVKVIALTSILNALYALYTNMGPTYRCLDYSRKEQFRDLLPGFVLAGATALFTWPLTLLHINDVAVIALQIVVAVASYIAMSLAFKVEAFYYCKNIVTDFFKKKGKERHDIPNDA